jgi:two-component sensor histidine kinase
MSNTIKSILQIGTNEDFQNWENNLIKKINTISLIGAVNMLLGIIMFAYLEYYNFILEFALCVLVFTGVVALNHYGKYLIAIYIYFVIGFFFLTFTALVMGEHSQLVLFYFPVVMSLVYLLGRKETMLHLILLSILSLVSLLITVLSYYNDWFFPDIQDHHFSVLATFNVILSFCSMTVFALIIVKDHIEHERTIKNMLNDKNILVAEVFHRVKNNLNIVTSLLNLQKNSSNSIEVQNALEECRSRIYSMALVHENLFNHAQIGLEFNSYVNKLVKDIEKTLGINGITNIELNADQIELDLEKAVPVGMILNELLTNAHKYGRDQDGRLDVTICLSKINGLVVLTVNDKGPGFVLDEVQKNGTLGYVLIESLSDQLGGKYTVTSENGMNFKLTF